MEITKDLIIRYFKAWFKALRLFSLPIAWVSCLLGVVLAFNDGYRNFLNAVLIMIAGSLLQTGVNLINDFFEFKQRNIDDKIPNLKIFGPKRELIEWIIFISGVGCFTLTIPIGLFLVYKTGIPLLILGIVGLIGGYFYTGEPFNYKIKGLGVLFVFFLMGVFMVTGSYYAMSGIVNLSVLLISIPVSSMVSEILLCNELRDIEADTRHGLKTLSVRIGYKNAVILYFLLIAITYGGIIWLYFIGLIPNLYFLLFGILFMIPPTIIILKNNNKMKNIIPWMMVHHSIFGLLFIGTYLIKIN